MDGEVGSQVSIHDGFVYGSRPFFQHQISSGNGYGTMYGLNHAAMSARFNSSNIETSKREDRSENTQIKARGWEGFSFMAPYGSQNGSHASKQVHALERERERHVRPADLRLDSTDGNIAVDLCTTEQRRKQSLFNNSSPTHQVSATRRDDSSEEDRSSLALKLSFPTADDAANGTRNPKRFRPSSPGSQSPVCQVDDCRTDLKNAKDYHRRHKVCELHSKAPHSLVQKVMQRFCQQCSRFHPLPEFDEGKRSCRRRLAGHNKRRRKTDLGTNGAPLSEVVKGTDLLSIVAILSQLQAAKAKDKPDTHNTEHGSILQATRKATPFPSLPTALLREPPLGVPQPSQTLLGPQRSIQESQAGVLGPLAGLSKDALLLFLRNVLQAQATSSQGRMQPQQVPQQHLSNDQSVHALYAQAASSPEDLPRSVLMDGLPFALPRKPSMSSGESNPAELFSRPNITRQYLGCTASYPLEDDLDSPPDSTETRPLEEQNFFPTESGGGLRSAAPAMGNRAAHSSGFNLQEEGLNLSPFTYRQDSALGGDKPSGQPSDSSEYGSDRSPSSSTSDGQELNGRIIFKLCDPKLMSTINENHQSEIQQWLSLTPGSVEAYLRPGCIMLTVFLSMPHRTWEELVANLRRCLKRLVRLSESDLWTKGRIIVQVGHQRALIVNGKVKRIRFSRAGEGPLLRSVRPLAVVAGQEATLAVCGNNLDPQTRILCVYQGRYVLHEVTSPVFEATGVDSSSSSSRSEEQVQRIHFPGGPPNVLGRCFIEVERDFMGNILPVIVANKEICSELRSLEGELDSNLSWQSEQSGDSSPDESRVNKEAEAMNFLHELGWIFQSTSQGFSQTTSVDGDFSSRVSLSRFKGLLRYAVLRDWCAVVNKLLDLLFSIGIKENAEVLHVLSEVNLLHQAVKRKCRPMVELLLRYVPNEDGSRSHYVFTPVVEGPGGFTALHIAASMSGAEDIINALTEDPSEVGLHGWSFACDHAGRTPEWHARNGGKFSYVELIKRKLSSKLSSSVSITVFDGAQNPAQANMECSNQRTENVGNQDTMLVELSAFSRRAALSSAQVCRDCRVSARIHPFRSSRPQSRMYRPLMMMMVTVAAVCATVALLFKSGPRLECVMYSLKWEGIRSGSV
eukprot:c20859_g1_i1 orf=776-4177(+)